MNTMTLEDLTDRTGLMVLDHLTLDAEIPVCSGPQAQGDVMVIPEEMARPQLRAGAVWTDVPAAGVALVAGQHTHTLVADPGTCRITRDVNDGDGMDVAVFDASAPVWLLHPEHGGSGVAPGRYVVRRQREQGEVARLVAD